MVGRPSPCALGASSHPDNLHLVISARMARDGQGSGRPRGHGTEKRYPGAGMPPRAGSGRALSPTLARSLMDFEDVSRPVRAKKPLPSVHFCLIQAFKALQVPQYLKFCNVFG